MKNKTFHHTLTVNISRICNSVSSNNKLTSDELHYIPGSLTKFKNQNTSLAFQQKNNFDICILSFYRLCYDVSLSLTAPLHKSLISPEGVRTTTDILFLVL